MGAIGLASSLFVAYLTISSFYCYLTRTNRLKTFLYSFLSILIVLGAFIAFVIIPDSQSQAAKQTDDFLTVLAKADAQKRAIDARCHRETVEGFDYYVPNGYVIIKGTPPGFVLESPPSANPFDKFDTGAPSTNAPAH